MKNITNINTKELEKLIASGSCHLIDVREPDEHKASSIPSAKNIPLSTLSKEKLAELSDKKIVVHCQSGVRSKKACDQILTWSNQDVLNLEGGISAWQKDSGKIEKKGCRFSIMQQVQIIAGGAVLLGVILSKIHSADWIYLSGFFGAGLLFAGISGWCGMAKLLNYLPWNKS